MDAQLVLPYGGLSLCISVSNYILWILEKQGLEVPFDLPMSAALG